MKSLLLFAYMMFNKSKLSIEEKGYAILNKINSIVVKAMTLLFIAISSVMLFAMSLTVLLVKIGNVLDAPEAFQWTNSMTMFLVLMLLSVMPLIYVRGKSKVQFEMKKTEEAASPSIEDALSMLIVDFVRARQESRSQEPVQPEASQSKTDASAPQEQRV